MKPIGPGTASRWRSGPWYNAALSGLVMLLVTGGMLMNFHFTMTREEEKSMRNSIRRAAVACALAVNPEKHASLTDTAQEGSEPYRALCDIVQKTKESMEDPEKFRFAYTCILQGNVVHFVIDPTPAGDSDGDGVDDKAHLMEPYHEASPELIRTLKTGAVTVMKSPQSDRWGTFISGYAPIRDASGKVIAAAGVDMDLDFYQNEIRDIRLGTATAALISVLVSLIACSVVWSHERKLHATIGRLEQATESAEAANEAKSRFLATMSHEIRTPMNGVLGFTQLLQHSELTTQQKDFIAAIRSSAESLLRVINDVLDFSKIESGHMEIEHRAFSLQSCIEEALETVSPASAEKGLDLAARISAEVPVSVVGDSLRLRQVLVNLLGNAVKFTASGTVKLEVDAQTESPGHVLLQFSVTDSGIGIAQNQIEHLFEAFHQEDSSTSRRFGGSGLGLAICKRLVELMGGSISVISQPNQGSTFSFCISMEVSDDPAPVISPIPYPDLIGKRILVVDGHEFSRRVISELLDRWGMEVRSADTAKHAADLIRNWQPQALLFDSLFHSQEDISFANSLGNQGAALFLLCQPAEAGSVRDRFRNADAVTLFKPIKVSPLFNALLAHTTSSEIRIIDPLRSPAPPPSNGRSLRLLLVEDNPINQKLALAALAQMNYTADLATDGHEAIMAVMATRYDVVIMDVQMPGMDGLEATRRIRAWEKETGAAPVRIIALTANALTGDRETCLNAGMDDYLSKPIRLEALRAALLHHGEHGSHPVEAHGEPSERIFIALRQLADDLSLDDAVSLASDFLADLDGLLSDIRNSIKLGNISDARRLAHSLKGTSSIFAITTLRNAAEIMEQSCDSQQIDGPAAAWPALEKAAHEAITELKSAVDRLQSTASVIKPMS